MADYAPVQALPLTPWQSANLTWMRSVEETKRDTALPMCKEEPVITKRNPFSHRSGGFLCDPTGTGKTRTVLEHIRRDWLAHAHNLPTLILVQPNIIMQWKRECDKWVPDLPVIVLYGNTRDALQKTLSQTVAIVLSTP
jgi:SNF2 family DNA or RNA helicase